jgi:hypothetical protein
MLKVTKYKTIAQDEDKYLSFPDIIKSPVKEDRLFLIYREGNNHHPTWSKLVLQISNNNGKTWKILEEFYRDLEKDGYVWNCPRLSYIDNTLVITCDQKSGTRERTAMFKTVQLISKNEGRTFRQMPTGMPGMVPDTIIKFKDKLFCANHKVKSERNDLIQLVSWSRDNGMTWYDSNIMAHSPNKQFCEASVVNMGDYLISYLRDNSGHKRNVYTVRSEDGIYWSDPHKLPIFGQRVTALKDEDQKGHVVGAYRNTFIPCLYPSEHKLEVSAFEHSVDDNKIKLFKIDWEHPESQYHFGYTGMVRIAPNEYIITYYVKQNEPNPYIKLAFVKKTKI